MRKILAFFGILLLFLLFTKPSYAADITGSYAPSSINYGDTVSVTITWSGIDPGTGLRISIDQSGWDSFSQPGLTGETLSVSSDCSGSIGSAIGWSEVNCSVNDTSVTTLTGKFDTGVTAEDLYQKNHRYVAYVDFAQAGEGFGFSDAPPVSFSIKNWSPEVPKEGDSLSITIENATVSHDYAIRFGESIKSSTTCSDSTCSLNPFTVGFITNTHTSVTVADMDSDPIQQRTANITFQLSSIGDEDVCLKCSEGSSYDFTTDPPQCSDASGNSVPPENQSPTCGDNFTCFQGEGCVYIGERENIGAPCENHTDEAGCSSIKTPFGSISTDVPGFVQWVLSFILGIAGGIVTLLIIVSGYRLMTSQGNPEKVQAAREQLTSAIVGLLFIIFSLFILQLITVDILKIPGFGE